MFLMYLPLMGASDRARRQCRQAVRISEMGAAPAGAAEVELCGDEPFRSVHRDRSVVEQCRRDGVLTRAIRQSERIFGLAQAMVEDQARQQQAPRITALGPKASPFARHQRRARY